MANEPNVQQPQDANDPPSETVVELADGMRGRWVVASQGSTHVWDLDTLTYTRRPGPASPSGRSTTTHRAPDHEGDPLAACR